MYQNFNLKSINKEYVIIGLFLMLGFLIGFGFGKLQTSNKQTPIVIDKNVKIGLPNQAEYDKADNAVNGGINGSDFMASINGTAYYPNGCKAADRIKEENRIWFKTARDAEAQGYRLAQNCK